jgi:hypothetical protein
MMGGSCALLFVMRVDTLDGLSALKRARALIDKFCRVASFSVEHLI